jgi:GDP-4-dehydro-6-deoxy-D-mannose reductase
MHTWVVTGGAGFLGGWILDTVRSLGYAPRTVAIGRRCPSRWPLSAFSPCNLLDLDTLRSCLQAIRPSVIIHAAGRTPPAPAQILRSENLDATSNLIDAIQSLHHPARLIAIGSAAELGPIPPQLLPAREDCPCQPESIYGQAKWEASQLVLRAPEPIHPIVARLFNLVGPGMPETQALGRFAAQLALAQPGEESILHAGNLEPRRDFIDVRDAVAAILALVEHGKPRHLYHVASGTARSIRSALEDLIAISGRRARILPDPHLNHPSEIEDSHAEITRITQHTAWAPRIHWQQSLRDLWKHAERQARSHRAAS